MTRGTVIRRGIVCLALGLVTTVVVAWGIALVQPTLTMTVVGSWHRTVDIWSKACVSEGRAVGLRRREIEWGTRNWSLGRLKQVQEPPMRGDGWGFSRATLARRLGGPGGIRTTEVGSGWPMPALWYGQERAVAEPALSLSGFSVTLPSQAGQTGRATGARPIVLLNGARLPEKWRLDDRAAGEPVVLPLAPVWTGLLVDTLVFAALLVPFVFVPPLLRARRRRWKGHCPKCRYDLLGNLEAGCPECGWGK